jgi:exodeoxyribonuclease VII small subunit
MGQQKTESSEQTFEHAIERLEHLVEEMEGDKLPLETLLERYEEGSKLVKVCQEKLEAAERRIEIITRGAAGKTQVAPFEPKAAATPEEKASETVTPATPSVTVPASASPAPKKKAAPSADVSLF